MLYLIGLGLNEKGISLEGLEAVKNCDKVYLESYTVDFPYSREKLGKILDVNIEVLGRSSVESNEIVKEAKDKDLALLIYGSPLVATTHFSLIEDAIEMEVDYKIINSASVFDSVVESGLQFYKFGKVASMPAWDEKKNYRPDSFMELVKDNQAGGSHSLILCDIGLKFKEALEQLKKSCEKHNFDIKEKEIVVGQSLGTGSQKFYYGKIKNLFSLNEKVENPFCIVIPGNLHHTEKRFLDYISYK
mgnify:CR=1 FL=1